MYEDSIGECFKLNLKRNFVHPRENVIIGFDANGSNVYANQNFITCKDLNSNYALIDDDEIVLLIKVDNIQEEIKLLTSQGILIVTTDTFNLFERIELSDRQRRRTF